MPRAGRRSPSCTGTRQRVLSRSRWPVCQPIASCSSKHFRASGMSVQSECMSGIVNARRRFRPMTSPFCSWRNEYVESSYIFIGRLLGEMCMSRMIENIPKQAANRSIMFRLFDLNRVLALAELLGMLVDRLVAEVVHDRGLDRCPAIFEDKVRAHSPRGGRGRSSLLASSAGSRHRLPVRNPRVPCCASDRHGRARRRPGRRRRVLSSQGSRTGESSAKSFQSWGFPSGVSTNQSWVTSFFSFLRCAFVPGTMVFESSESGWPLQESLKDLYQPNGRTLDRESLCLQVLLRAP